jgi:hydrogenase maturation protease
MTESSEAEPVNGRIIVAGVGNIFLGDDGFGVEVIRHLAERPLPPGVEVIDVGIRGVHLAYNLLDGCGLLILVDTAARGEPPGTVSVIEVDPDSADAAGPSAGADPAGAASGRPPLDPHGMAPHEVFGLLTRLGGSPARTLVVACEPADLTPGMDLSDPVRAAVPRAAVLVEALLAQASNQPKGRCGDVVQTRYGSARGRAPRGGGAVDPGHPAVPEDPRDVMARPASSPARGRNGS